MPELEKSVPMRAWLLVFALLLTLPTFAQTRLQLEAPLTVLKGVEFKVKVVALTAEGHRDAHFNGPVTLSAVGGQLALTRNEYRTDLPLELEHGVFEGRLRLDRTGSVEIQAGEEKATVRVIAGWLSLLPPLMAIVLALTVRQVLLSLLSGIWLGATILQGGLFAGYQSTLDHFLVKSLANEDHVYILLFTLLLGGLVSLISRSGGMLGMVDWIARYAKGYRSSQVATWFMGVAIFFDDYANTLLVGNTMRPLTDRFKISREKLSYLVDSTAAPISSVAVISTWIGYEMSLIQSSFENLGIEKNIYEVFLESIVYRYYATFTLVFVLAIAWLGRDFGPMYKAERRAFLTGELIRDGATPLADPDEEHDFGEDSSRNPWNAIIPVGVVLLGTLVGLYATGMQELGGQLPEQGWLKNLGLIFGKSNSFKALLWAAAAGGIVAFVTALIQKALTLEEAVEVYVRGVLHMANACIVLVLAWAIGNVCTELYTAGFLVESTRDFLSARMLPLLTFLISAAVAFATGTSWGTMAIVMPIAIELGHSLPGVTGLSPELSWSILVGTIAGVLAGSTFGDHCSPISDTTIMSSMASASDHVDHVRTQIPYALTTAFLACLIGAVPGGWGVNPWLLNLVGIVACVAVVRVLGRPARAVEPE